MANNLSVCVMTRDEERFLDECLSSVVSIADEIVVADTGSSDRTIEIARHYTSEVHEIDFRSDFAAARNLVLELAEGKWVLFLDADERLEAAEAAQIPSLIATAESDVYGFRMFRYDFYTTGGWFCSRRTRLFRNLSSVRYRGSIHDEIDSSIRDAGARIRESPVLLDHLGHCRSPSEREAKSRRYLKMLRRSLGEGPDGDRLALVALQLRNLRRFSAARRASDAALSCDPQSPLVHKYRGHVLRSIAEPAGAAASYAAGLELTPIEDVGERACFLSLIGVCAMMSGDLETAEARLVDARAAGPELPHLLVNAGVIREARGDLVGALDLFDRAAEMHPPFLFEAPLERLEETAFTSLEYDAVPHFMGLQRHIDHCRAQLQREAPNA